MGISAKYINSSQIAETKWCLLNGTSRTEVVTLAGAVGPIVDYRVRGDRSIECVAEGIVPRKPETGPV
jgi:hypothetical protein